METLAKRIGFCGVLFWALAAWLTACSGGTPEVWVQFLEDDTFPCLGAAQMKVEIWVKGQMEKQLIENGIFFRSDNQHCQLKEYRYPELPQGLGIEVWVSLFDSTLLDPNANPQGLLSQSKSLTFDVDGGNWIRQLTIRMSRNLPGSQPGTLVVKEPADWSTVSGVKRLQCQLSQGTTPVRDTFVEEAVKSGFSPFPLFVSGIPLTGVFDLTITAVDAQNSALRAWKRTGISMDTGKLWTVEIQ